MPLSIPQLSFYANLPTEFFEEPKKEYDEYAPDLNLKWTYGEGRDVFKNSIESNDNFVAVCEINNKIVGYLCGSLCNPTWRDGRGAEVDNMFVEEKFRNNGVGSLLLNKFIDWCEEKQLDYVNVRSSIKNFDGIEFYRKSGFKDYHVVLEMKLINR